MTISYDVMLDNRFVGTLTHEYCPLWPIDGNELMAHTERKFPQVRGKDYKIKFNEPGTLHNC